MTNKLVFESESAPAVKALDELRASASNLTKAFITLSEASPKKLKADVASLATAVASMTGDMIGSVSALQKQLSAMEGTLATSARAAVGGIKRAVDEGGKAATDSAKGFSKMLRQELQQQYDDLLKNQQVFTLESLGEWRKMGASLAPVHRKMLSDAAAFTGELQAIYNKAYQVGPSQAEIRAGLGARGLMTAANRANLESARYDGGAADARDYVNPKTLAAVRSFVAGLEADSARVKAAYAKTYAASQEGSAAVLSSYAEYYRGQERMDAIRQRILTNRERMLAEETTQAARQKVLTASNAGSAAMLSGMRDYYLGQGAKSNYTSTSAAELQKVESAAGRVSQAFKTQTSHANDLHSAYRGLASGFGAMWLTWGNILPLLAGAAVSHAASQAVKIGADVGQSLAVIQHLGGATTEEMVQLNKALLDTSRSGPFGPREVAKALETLSLAGLSAKEQMEALKPTLDFAIAGQMPIEKAAETLIAVSTAFGYAAKDIGVVSDVIAKTAAISMATTEGMASSFKVASVIAQQYGVSLKDVATSLALLAQIGIKDQAAGTAVRQMYNELLGSSAKARKVLKETLDFDLFEKGGQQVKSLNVAFTDLSAAFIKLDLKSQTRVLQDMGNERGTKALAANLEAVRTAFKDSGESAGAFISKMKGVQDQLKESPGFSAIAAIGVGASSQNQLKETLASLQTALVEAFQAAEPVIIRVAHALQEVFRSTGFREGVTAVVSGIAELTSYLITTLGSVYKLVEGFDKATGTMTALSLVAQAVTGTIALLNDVMAAVGSATEGSSVAARALTAVLQPMANTVSTLGDAYSFLAGGVVKTSKAAQDAEAGTVRTHEGLDKEISRLQNLIDAKGDMAKARALDARATEEAAIKQVVSAGAARQAILEEAKAELLRANARAEGWTWIPGMGDYVQGNINRIAALDSRIEALGKDTFRGVELLSNKFREVEKLSAAAEAAAENRRTKKTSTGTGTYTGDDKKERLGSNPDYANALKAIKAIEQEHRSVAEKMDLEAKASLDLQKFYYDAGIANFAQYQAQVTGIQDANYTKRRDDLQAQIKEMEAGKDALTRAAAANPKKAGALESDIKSTDAAIESLRTNLQKLDDSNVARLRSDFLGAAKGILDLNAASEKTLETIKAETALEVEKYSVKNDVVNLTEKEAFVQEKVLAFTKSINKEIRDRQLALKQATDNGAFKKMGEDSPEGQAAKSAYEKATQSIADLQAQATTSVYAVSEAYAQAYDDGITKKFAKELNEKLTDAILDAGKDGGKGLVDFLRNELIRKPFKIFLEGVLGPLSGSIAGLLTGNSGSGAGGLLGTASNISSLNTLYGAGTQFLTGGSAGASGASLLYANGVQTLGGDGLGALISGNASWSGVAVGGATAAGAGSAFAAGGASSGAFGVGAGATGVTDLAIGSSAVGAGAPAAAAGLGGIPVYGWIALAALAAYSVFSDKDPASETTGDTTAKYNAAGVRTGSHAGFGFETTQTSAAADALQAGYVGTAKSLGIGTVDTTFGTGGNSDGKTSHFAVGSSAGGKGYHSADNLEYSDDAYKLEASRAIFSALQGSDLPKYLAGAFDGIVASSATQDQITTALNSAGALKQFHDQLQTMPFEQLKDMSYATSKALIEASGSLDNLKASLTSYYDNFYSADEKRANTVRNITNTLNAAGAGLTENDVGGASRKAFRALVESTDENSPLFAALMNVNAAFASIVPEVEDAKVSLESAFASIGNMSGDLSKIILDGINNSDPAGAGQFFADTLVYGVQNALYQGFAEQITSIITDQLVTPMVTAMATGASISSVISAAAIENMVAQANAAAVVLNAILSDPTFQSALSQISTTVSSVVGNSIAAVSRPTYSAPAYRGGVSAGGGGGGGGGSGLDAWQKATDSIVSTMKDLRETLLEGGNDSFIRLQAQFAIDTAKAKAGDLKAYEGLPELAKALATAGKSYTRSAVEQAVLTGRIIESLGSVVETRTGAKVPGFAVGTDYVPRDMLALVHEGERITPRAFNPAIGNGGSNDEEIRALRQQVAALHETLARIERNTRNSAGALDEAAGGSRPLYTKALA